MQKMREHNGSDNETVYGGYLWQRRTQHKANVAIYEMPALWEKGNREALNLSTPFGGKRW